MSLRGRSAASLAACLAAAAGLSGCALHGRLRTVRTPVPAIVTLSPTPPLGLAEGPGTGAAKPPVRSTTTPTVTSGGTGSGPETATGAATGPAAGGRDGTTTVPGGTATTTGTGTGTTDGSGTTSTPTTTLPGSGHPTIALGDENTPEQFLLGELYRTALVDEGYSVSLTQNIGTSAIAQQALAQGTLDLYPAYLNQWDGQVAGLTTTFASTGAAYLGGERYAEDHGIALLAPTPFSDTAGIAVTAQLAAADDLRTLHGLSHVPGTFTLGAPLEFSAPGGGLSQLERQYGFTPTAVQQIDLGSQYAQLSSGALEAAFVQTTDPQLASPQFTLLGDPEHVLGFGNVVPVTTPAVLAAEGQEFAITIDRVSALLTMRVMRQLNGEVEQARETPADIATAFLAANHIVPQSGTS